MYQVPICQPSLKLLTKNEVYNHIIPIMPVSNYGIYASLIHPHYFYLKRPKGAAVKSVAGAVSSGKLPKARNGAKEFDVHNLYLNLRLDDVQNFLASGNPPIFLQLGCIVVLWMMIFVYQRMRQRTAAARHGRRAIRWLLIFACFAVVSEDQWLPFVMHSQQRIRDQIGTAIWRL
jgi:hypothetical protein